MTDLQQAVIDPVPPQPPPPAHRAAVIARTMRKLTGVREELLDKIPAERTRYTALAAVMICTATIGGFSMFFALSEVLGRAQVWFVFLAIFWSVFILCIDCWLVSSTAGSRWRTRVSVLIPRLAIAAVFGVVIAEPLVLRVFQNGIDDHVMQTRQNAIDAVRSALVACNPIPGIAGQENPPRTGCTGMTLNIANPAAASLTQIRLLQTQATALQTQVNSEQAQLTTLQNTVNDECNGAHGTGLTGLLGNGPACKKDQAYASNYSASHPVGAQITELASLNQQIRSLQAALARQQGNYRALISAAIAHRLRIQTQPTAPIGMAERFQALTFLSTSNAFIGIASWFVRIFFILIDCLPVLVKFISGSTPYDRLIDIEIASAEKRFSRTKDMLDGIVDMENDVISHEAKADTERRSRAIDLEMLRHDADRATDTQDAVDELWRKKMRARRSETMDDGSTAPGRDPGHMSTHASNTDESDWLNGTSWNGSVGTEEYINGSRAQADDAADPAID